MSKEREILHFPLSCAIHSPTYSGVRVTADATDYARTLYEVPGPLIVVEEDSVFTGITWDPWNPRIGHTKPDVLAEGNSWKIAFPPGASIRHYPPESTLEGAVTHYREEHRMPPPSGKGTPGSHPESCVPGPLSGGRARCTHVPRCPLPPCRARACGPGRGNAPVPPRLARRLRHEDAGLGTGSESERTGRL